MYNYVEAKFKLYVECLNSQSIQALIYSLSNITL